MRPGEEEYIVRRAHQEVEEESYVLDSCTGNITETVVLKEVWYKVLPGGEWVEIEKPIGSGLITVFDARPALGETGMVIYQEK